MDEAASKGYTKIFVTHDGIGDSLGLLFAARNMAERGTKVLIGLKYPELAQRDDYCDVIGGLYDHTLSVESSLLFASGIKPVLLTYWRVMSRKSANGKMISGFPDKHLFAELCAKMGISGTVEIIPRLCLSEEEKTFGKFFPHNQVAVISEGREAYKTWGAEKIQLVINMLTEKYNFIQIGCSTDKELNNCLDKRGMLSLRQVAAVLYNSDLFVGGIGGLMHLARAVGRRSVIAFSRAEPLEFDSYPCNFNILPKDACSRCLEENIYPSHIVCGNTYSCVRSISVQDIIKAIEDAMSADNANTPLETETVFLEEGLAAPELSKNAVRIAALMRRK